MEFYIAIGCLIGWFIGYFLGFFLPYIIWQLIEIKKLNKKIKEQEKFNAISELSLEEKRRLHDNARNKDKIFI